MEKVLDPLIENMHFSSFSRKLRRQRQQAKNLQEGATAISTPAAADIPSIFSTNSRRVTTVGKRLNLISVGGASGDVTKIPVTKKAHGKNHKEKKRYRKQLDALGAFWEETDSLKKLIKRYCIAARANYDNRGNMNYVFK